MDEIEHLAPSRRAAVYRLTPGLALSYGGFAQTADIPTSTANGSNRPKEDQRCDLDSRSALRKSGRSLTARRND